MERQITQSEVATAAADAVRNDSYHCYPGVIVSYDATQETASIQVGTNDVRIDIDTGARISEPFDVLAGVPIAWMRFGGFVIKGPLVKYDPVMLLAIDLDPAPWRQAGRTLKPVDPGDIRRHGAGYWFALPVNLLLGHPQGGAPSGTLTIGAEGQAPVIEITGSTIQLGSTGNDFVALASKVDACMNLIKAHIHVSAAAGSPTGPPLTPPSTPLALPPTGSALIKAQ